MEKDSYPIIEEHDSLMAAESVATTMPDAVPQHHCDFIPTGMPQTVEEALSDIDEGEREFERGETFSHREVMQMVWDKIGCYAG
jgi:hypothetical protein